MEVTSKQATRYLIVLKNLHVAHWWSSLNYIARTLVDNMREPPVNSKCQIFEYYLLYFLCPAYVNEQIILWNSGRGLPLLLLASLVYYKVL